MNELNRIYRMFRKQGATAVQAYAAAFCAVRVSAFHDDEIQSWIFLFGSRNPSQLRAVRDAMKDVPVKR